MVPEGDRIADLFWAGEHDGGSGEQGAKDLQAGDVEGDGCRRKDAVVRSDAETGD